MIQHDPGCSACARLASIEEMVNVLAGDMARTTFRSADDPRALIKARTFTIAWMEITAEAVRRVHEQHRADGCPDQKGRMNGN